MNRPRNPREFHLGIRRLRQSSTDGSAAIATEKNVRVVHVSRQGEGNVVRAMLKWVEADVYVMLDARRDVSGHRIPDPQTGKVALCRLISLIWGARLTDVLSGYRAFTARRSRAPCRSSRAASRSRRR